MNFTLRLGILMVLTTWLLLGCNSTEQKRKALEPLDMSQGFQPEDSNTAPNPMPLIEKRYVASSKGLKVYDGPTQGSESHASLGYGIEVDHLRRPAGDSMTIDNIPGRLLPIHFAGQMKGYVFSGLLSTLPMPPSKDNTQRWDFQEDYARSLQAQGIDASFEWYEMKAGGDHAELRIPAANIYEAFLITKQLYGIPEEYDFPTDPHVVLSTPENPSLPAQTSPYDYVRHEIRTKFLKGKPVSLSYIDDTEVGGKTISVWEDNGKWVLQWIGFVH